MAENQVPSSRPSISISEEKTDWKSELLHMIKKSELEVVELKRRRSEDAKANERVLSIFAAREQSWLSERRKLRQTIGSLINELRVLETDKEKIILNLSKKVEDSELIIQSRGKALEGEEAKGKEIEEKLQKLEDLVCELRETTKKEGQEHTAELWKHKTAFLELVSNQRQLEAEMGRALRQVESTKQEFDSVYAQKEESVSMVQKLSMELVRTRKDLEQKDKILSAMLRKSKLDTSEKQMLLKEVKISKSRRKQAEVETERWRTHGHESRYERHSSKSNLVYQIEEDFFEKRRTGSQPNFDRVSPKTLLLDYLEADRRKERDGSNQCSPEESGELVTADVKHLESWIRLETKKNTTMLEQRHHLEIDAFAEELRHKNEKLEASRWQLLSMELESKRLKSHIEELDQNLSQVNDENMKLEALLFEQEADYTSLKEELDSLQLCTSQVSRETEPKDETSSLVQVPEEEIEVEKEVTVDIVHVGDQCTNPKVVEAIDLTSNNHCSMKLSKIDLHALGVSYNIKRLKQQLLLLKKLVGMQNGCEERMSDDDNGKHGKHSFLYSLSLLNKQVSRYESLQEKINNLCSRMHENGLDGSSVDSQTAMAKEETKSLQIFLGETFQLQRYMVAAGQKLMEIKSKITFGFIRGLEEVNKSASFDTKRFSDSVQTLFKEVQRGLEVRISRIIGNLEGTLACEGITHFKN
ncbi:hypothetical protein GIB67_033405 [Kingdonia uniflora]|uniref:Uncharacterized protein n=1 Tax=Kingdonia uniflora TaxID=39325 RepID=A0A7J7LTN5_9MAGN|nr:hypothetical protein GIB67_033405 [Kingdonia uniflora]